MNAQGGGGSLEKLLLPVLLARFDANDCCVRNTCEFREPGLAPAEAAAMGLEQQRQGPMP